MTPYKAVLIFGAPGTGKGTQGKILGNIPGFYHFSCGEVFRNLDITSDLGREFYEYSSRGELVPDELTVRLWVQAIHAHTVLGDYKPLVDLLILDGIPRTPQQAKLMSEYVDVLKVVHLHCEDEQAMVERLRKRALKENRYDDADEKVIRQRWQVYQRETFPLLEYYPQKDVVAVDSIGSPGRVLRDVLDQVVPVQDEHYVHPL
ncbi:MAG: nucleoside monophosphate kinase [Gammaproteobacteria bacterium]|nr:nucleoside monophosphate kinase [Gammaproteobacteria bacterium]MCP5458651.1 nucleoside monophosphate kinase [Gammaproteobacteria bacterium]